MGQGDEIMDILSIHAAMPPKSVVSLNLVFPIVSALRNASGGFALLLWLYSYGCEHLAVRERRCTDERLIALRVWHTPRVQRVTSSGPQLWRVHLAYHLVDAYEADDTIRVGR